MPRRIFLPILAILALCCLQSASAQTSNPSQTYDVSWSNLDPGQDWVAQVIQSIFPINNNPCSGGTTTSACTGSEATVIGNMLGQLTGFTMALVMAYLCYLTIWHIYRAAETSNLLTSAMTSMFILRVGFAAVMMFPVNNGFSVGQAAVVQTALWGIGMADALYKSAITAIGPDALVIAQPIIPGVKSVVLNMMENELCRAFVNAATGNSQIAPEPVPTTVSGSVTWAYYLAPGNQTGSPSCGTITVVQPTGADQTIAGVDTNMATQQQQILQNVLTNDIRPVANSVAVNYFSTKKTSALTPLLAAYQTATSDYTQLLTSAATNIQQQLQAALHPQDARSGSLGLSSNTTTNLSSLGWASAGAYYLTFAQINGRTLSLLNNLPIVNGPSYNGWSTALKTDLAPLISASDAFLWNLRTYVNTTDSATPPTGNTDTFGNSASQQGGSFLESVLRAMNLNETLLNLIANAISPTGNQWTDPFGSLITLGQVMATAAIGAYGLASVAASGTLQTGSAAFYLLTGNLPAAIAATGLATLSDLFKALLTPIFFGLMSLLIPGLLIAYVLPLIPWVMWMAGVAGYLILVIEAVVAVPLMMFAHMTFEGDGLHGKAIQVYELLFNVLFRPVLMLIGLFTGYFIFASISWLIRTSFGIATHFVLEKGWLLTNLFGVIVLLAIFVMLHIYVAWKSFNMISLIPHHVPRMLGFSSANRVDVDDFAKAVAWTGTDGVLRKIDRFARLPLTKPTQGGGQGEGAGSNAALPQPQKQLPRHSGGSSNSAGVDSTLAAQTDLGEHAKET